MALNKLALKNGIRAMLDDMATRETDADIAREDFAVQLSDLIDAFVKTGTPQVPALGLISAAAGQPVTGASVTGTII